MYDAAITAALKVARDCGTYEGALINIIHLAESSSPDPAAIAKYAREVLAEQGSKHLPAPAGQEA